MKIGTHDLGSNAFSHRTLVRLSDGSMVIRQMGHGKTSQLTLSGDQVVLLKELLT
ncbi:MAG: hypothetical protein ACK4IS_07280 [Erythrobacter sp.]